MAKVISFRRLIELHIDAVKKGYNRTLPDEARLALDPNGISVVESTLVHGDAECVRAVLLLKLKGTDEAGRGTLDIDFDNYNKLPEYDDIVKTAKERAKPKAKQSKS